MEIPEHDTIAVQRGGRACISSDQGWSVGETTWCTMHGPVRESKIM